MRRPSRQALGRGREARLDNLILLRRRHDRSVHEEGYTIETGSDGAFHFFRPAGSELPQGPPPPDLRSDAVTSLVESLTEAGVEAALDTLMDWGGDLGATQR